jgi:hypothetical protein
MIVTDLRTSHMRQFETVWMFDVACSDGGAHSIDPVVPIRCKTCGAEAVERQRKVPG